MSEGVHNSVIENEAKRFVIEDYLNIIRYRKWLLVLPVIVLTFITAIGSQFMTDIYRAQTSILVSAGDVPDDFIRTTVTDSIEERITTIREQILSETLLLNVIRTHNLYPEMANSPTEELLGRIKANINIRVSAKNAFQISFTGQDPMIVQSVTNHLAQSFIDETVGDRQKSALATADFLAEQLEEIKGQLDEQEEKVAAFKRKHIGMLPEQMEANQRTLDRMQQQLQSLGEQINDAENRKVMLESQMAQLQGDLMATGSGELMTMQDQLESLQAQLNQLLQTLTPEHPDVKSLKEKIKTLQGSIGSDQTVGGRQYRVTSLNRGLFERLKQTTRQIQGLERQRSSVLAQINRITGRVAEAPAVEQEMSLLVRDLEKLRETYKDLQKKHMEAQQAAALEAQQKGRQFKIIDEARFPEKPYKPNRTRLVALSFVLGLFIGVFAIFIAEHIDHSIRDDDDLAQFSGKVVLATVPRFTLEEDERRRSNYIKLGIAVAAAFGFLLLLYVIIKVGFGVDLLRVLF